VSTRSFTLQQVVWALALEVGSRVTPFHQACQALREHGKWNLNDPHFDELLIRKTYAILEDRHPQYRNSYEHALSTALAQLATEQRRQP